MELVTLLKRELPETSYRLIGYSALTGIASAGLIGIINTAAETVANNEWNWELSILYVLCLGIVFTTKRYVLDQSAELVETIVNKLRYRLANKIRHTELVTLEKKGTATIYARISQDAGIISSTSTLMIHGSQHIVVVTFTLLYILSISTWSFFLIAAGLGFGAIYFIGLSTTFGKMWQEVSIKETQFFDKLSYILAGFKEIKINRLKNEKVFNNYIDVINDVRQQRLKTVKHYNVRLLFTEIFFYVLLGVILFVLPKLHAEHSQVLIKVVASVLFIIGPLNEILFAIPSLANANNSAKNIMVLEAELEEELSKLGSTRLNPNAPEAYLSLPFEQNIVLSQMTFQYPPTRIGPSFQVGPIDLTIKKGELIFITGGNGSGKSTFLKLFTGLYQPTRGHIEMDKVEQGRGTMVNLHNYQQYRNNITTIFSDYHLLDKLYGVKGKVDEEIVNSVLEIMDLPPEKVSFKNDTFTSIRLSSGQKKRVALTTAIVEDKEIFIFDEVAADLDPTFRDKFYYELLPALKRRNKTILAVSHDQQYWMVPDRMLHFQDGMAKELTKAEMKSLVEMAIK